VSETKNIFILFISVFHGFIVIYTHHTQFNFVKQTSRVSMSENEKDNDNEEEEDEIARDRQKKWRMKGEGDDEDERCPACVILEQKVDDLMFELDAERRDAECTIRDVEKMEEKHKQELEKLYRELDFEKDKVAALSNTLEHERQARMKEIYKIERQTLEHDHTMKEYKYINVKNARL
jgi:hypothetical protein